MMVRSSPAGTGLFFLGLYFFIICDSQAQMAVYSPMESEVTKYMFQCYDCNSEYDPRCGDPFNPYSIGIVNCTERKIPEQLRNIEYPDRQLSPSICRKMVQKVEGKTRVIRGCGYIRDPFDDLRCYRRTGTAGVEIHYCSCTKSMCNPANSIHISVILAIILALFNLTVN